MRRDCTHSLEAGSDGLSEDQLKRALFHADNINTGQLAGGDGNYEFHADERRADNDELLALLAR